jgi:hypothetical protein
MLARNRAKSFPINDAHGANLTVVAVVCVAVVAAVVTGIGMGLDRQAVLLTLSAGVILAFSAMHYMRVRSPLDPVMIVSFGFLYYYVAGPFYIHFYGDSTGAQLDMTWVLMLSLTGYFLFCLAYYSKWGERQGKRVKFGTGDLSADRLLVFSILILVVTTSFRPILTMTGLSQVDFLDSFGQLVTLSVALAPLLALASYTIRPSRWRFAAFVIVLAIFAFYTLFAAAAERRTVLRLALFLVVFWNFRVSKIPLVAFFVMGMLAVVAIFALKVQQNMVHYPRSLWSVDLFVRITYYMFDAYGVQFAIARSFDNLTGVENFKGIIDAISSGQTEYLLGSSYLKTFVAAVPRELWADKPINVANMIREVVQTGYRAGAQGVTILGEMYWNGGVIGLYLGTIVLGLFGRSFYTWLISRKDATGRVHVQRAMIYAITLPILLEHFRGAFHVINLTYFVSFLVPLLLVIALSGARERTPEKT